jgi:peptidoglycan/LPS O-acetylase OafA/YrhL
LLIALAVIMARRWPDHERRVAGVIIMLVVAASLTWSVYYTPLNPAAAYFVTPTRMWELGAGGALAVIYPRVKQGLGRFHRVRLGLVVVGIGLIGCSAMVLRTDSFPGSWALIPVVGSVLIIGAGPGERYTLDRLLGVWPIRLLGDISYSVYLWHWPFIIIATWALGHLPAWPLKLAIIAGTLVVAWASKTFIEDRFRGSHPLGVLLRRTFLLLSTDVGLGRALRCVSRDR